MLLRRATLLAAVLLTVNATAFAADAKKAKPAAAKATSSSATERLGEFGDWQAYAYGESGAKVCYAIAAAAKTDGGAKDRVPSHLSVTHRANSKNEVSLIGKYQFKPDSDAELAIEGKKFAFFSKGDSAWSKQANADKDIVAALAKGNSAVVRATPAKGKAVTDTISLKGFGKALAAIDKACGVKREAEKPAAKAAPAKDKAKDKKKK